MDKRNINNFSRLYRRTKVGVGATGSAVRVELSRIKPRVMRVLSHVTVENESNAYTKCRLGITNGGVNHYLDELQTIAACELAVSRSDIILGEGDIFFAELTGTTNDDVLILTCVGWEMDL
jgi:hypothetical protein